MPSPFDLSKSIEKAQKRLESPSSGRRKRSDIGKFRFPAEVRAHLERLLSAYEHPGIQTLLQALHKTCREKGLSCPSRATVYKFMQRCPGEGYKLSALPEAVRAALYNMSPDTSVPGAQLVFYCFNYGELAAIHFAAGLPWLPLYQAHRMRGWRPKSRGLLRAVMRTRGIPLG
jgi:hypothetical protein